MPRANRYWVTGAAYHLTHRCHDRAFLLRFVGDRDEYRTLLREELSRADVQLLNYTITCNHVHLLVTSPRPQHVARLMQAVQGRFAEMYNRRKGRQGAFWSDRYHATQIDSGEHLIACLRYIDLNMVRAGVVKHPREWPWTGWHEMAGARERAWMVDRDALLARIEGVTWTQFQNHYRRLIDDAIAPTQNFQRDARWTESVAVGRPGFVSRVEAELVTDDRRRRLQRTEMPDGTWILRERSPDYGVRTENGLENSPITPEIGCFSA